MKDPEDSEDVEEGVCEDGAELSSLNSAPNALATTLSVSNRSNSAS